jgi:hypothetical protein
MAETLDQKRARFARYASVPAPARAMPEEFPPRFYEWWRVRKPGADEAIDVFVCPRQSAREMAALYPGAAISLPP